MGQVEFWQGKSGDDYIGRNTEKELLHTYTSMWYEIQPVVEDVGSVLEIGANIGIGLQAVKHVLRPKTLGAIEPNAIARKQLVADNFDVYNETAQGEWKDVPVFDLVFTRGVLIHIDPVDLNRVYANMVAHTRKYLLVGEYFAPKREMIPYRGKDNLLWRADYAGEIMDRHPEMKLIDYFFIYSRDNLAPQDNITVFILEKQK